MAILEKSLKLNNRMGIKDYTNLKDSYGKKDLNCLLDAEDDIKTAFIDPSNPSSITEALTGSFGEYSSKYFGKKHFIYFFSSEKSDEQKIICFNPRNQKSNLFKFLLINKWGFWKIALHASQFLPPTENNIHNINIESITENGNDNLNNDNLVQNSSASNSPSLPSFPHTRNLVGENSTINDSSGNNGYLGSSSNNNINSGNSNSATTSSGGGSNNNRNSGNSNSATTSSGSGMTNNSNSSGSGMTNNSNSSGSGMTNTSNVGNNPGIFSESNVITLQKHFLEYINLYWSSIKTDLFLLCGVNNKKKTEENERTMKECWIEMDSRGLFSLEILGLECRLGYSKSFSFGVFFGQKEQTTEEAMFDNTSLNHNQLKFLNMLGRKVELSNWDHYSGGRELDLDKSIYYTCWKGFEITFNVAPFMSENDKRQYVGNNKLLIFFIDRDTPLKPHFRGSVNSVAFVVQPDQKENSYKLVCFWRKRIINFIPKLPSSLIENKDTLREYIFSNAIEGLIQLSRSPPTSKTINKIFTDEISNLKKKYIKK